MAENTFFAQCPQCKKCQLRVKSTKFDTVFISCTGYPKCKNSMNLPKGVINLRMLDKFCEKCLKKNREVQMFRLTFDKEIVNESMAEVLPEGNNTTGVFCVFQGCDDAMTSLNMSTKGMQFKRTGDQQKTFNKDDALAQENPYYNSSVPNYYY